MEFLNVKVTDFYKALESIILINSYRDILITHYAKRINKVLINQDAWMSTHITFSLKPSLIRGVFITQANHPRILVRPSLLQLHASHFY